MNMYFRRRNFYGKNMGTPAWHIHTEEYPGDYAPFVGLCGYTYTNLLGRLLFSEGKPAKSRGAVCRKCASKLAHATPLT
jgi:hypothetical protein